MNQEAAKPHEQERALQKRARILDATLALAIGGGLGAVTHRRVSEAAGVSLSAIRYYYRSREDLLLACIAEAERVRDADAHRALAGVDTREVSTDDLARLLLIAYYGAEIGDAELVGILRFTVDCSRESSHISAALARLRESSINPQLTSLLAHSGWTNVDASLASAVLDGSILASAAEGRSDIAERAIAALVSVLELSRRSPGARDSAARSTGARSTGARGRDAER